MATSRYKLTVGGTRSMSMANLQARADQRIPSLNNLGPGNMPSNNQYGPIAHGAFPYNMPGSSYTQLANSQLQHSQVQLKDLNNQMESMSHAIGGLNLQSLTHNGPGRMNGTAVPANLMNVAAVNPGHAGSQLYYQLSDGRILVPGVNSSNANYHQNGGTYSVTPAQAQYLQQASYHVNQALPSVQKAHAWHGNQQFAQDIPELSARRRNSMSSNEETGPRTPFFGAQTRLDLQPKISVPDNSPQAWTTPSPEQLGQSFYPQPLAKTPDGQYTFCDLDAVCQQDPPIPRPVPAIFSGEKGRGTLEKSLHNLLNTTNVYIRGLHPDTTDEMLHAYGARFGDIISAKSMLDQHTGLCKGFGFIKYHSFNDGENCIRGFFHWGYEAKWARVSHNEKLKTLSDVDNTNLYISGLPLTYNEYTLKGIFKDYDCLSAKILRDPNGLSRGVGFARFATPEICDKIIAEYNAKPIGTEGHLLGVRYSDTQAQKQLKTVTAERRQFKTHEYNTVVFGTPSPYLSSPNAQNFASPLQARIPGPNSLWQTQAQVSPLYQTFPNPVASYQVQGTGPIRNNAENTLPLMGRGSSRIKIESPSASAGAKRAKEQGHVSGPSIHEISSPSSVSGDDSPLIKIEGGTSSQSYSRPSPSKSMLSKPSPAKSHTGSNLSKAL